jgi:hypothetical protein
MQPRRIEDSQIEHLVWSTQNGPLALKVGGADQGKRGSIGKLLGHYLSLSVIICFHHDIPLCQFVILCHYMQHNLTTTKVHMLHTKHRNFGRMYLDTVNPKQWLATT